MGIDKPAFLSIPTHDVGLINSAKPILAINVRTWQSWRAHLSIPPHGVGFINLGVGWVVNH
jgi:hypothetical protein